MGGFSLDIFGESLLRWSHHRKELAEGGRKKDLQTGVLKGRCTQTDGELPESEGIVILSGHQQVTSQSDNAP